jgi:predicted ATPase
LGALSLWMLGYPDQAGRSAEEAVTLAESLDYAPSLAHALAFAGLCHQLRRDAPMVMACGERLVALGSEHRLAQYRAVGTIARGWAIAHQGTPKAGLAELRRGLDDYAATKVKAWFVYFNASLAEAYYRVGDAKLGLDAVNEALALSDSLSERLCQAGMLHLKGAILNAISADHRSDAETCYREALALAQQQGARSVALRASTSLARLWQEGRRRNDARDLLAPIYASFAEGLDTADLKEARLLLDEL